MVMKKVRHALNFVVILSEISHVFCCVLPTLFSIAGIMAGLGLAGTMPLWMSGLHEMIHKWEIPMILTSGFILLLGWSFSFISSKLDCHDTGCHHGPCEPKKKSATMVMKVATILFIANVSVFLIFHKGFEALGLSGGEHNHNHHSAAVISSDVNSASPDSNGSNKAVSE